MLKSLSFKINQAGSKTALESYLVEDAEGMMVKELLHEIELMYISFFAKIMAQKGKSIRKKNPYFVYTSNSDRGIIYSKLEILILHFSITESTSIM